MTIKSPSKAHEHTIRVQARYNLKTKQIMERLRLIREEPITGMPNFIAYVERRGKRGYFIWAYVFNHKLTGQGASAEEALRSFELETRKMADDLEWHGQFELARLIRCSRFEFFTQCELPKKYLNDGPYELY